MLEILIELLSLILIFFLPGFLLTLIIWPKNDSPSKEHNLLVKCVIGIIFSMIISIIAGIVFYGVSSISASPEVQSIRLWLTLGVISIIFGYISWKRGGLRDLVGRRPLAAKGKLSIDEELNRLSIEKRRLQEKIALMESEEYKSDQVLREEAAVRIPMLKKEIAGINERIDELIEREEKGKDGERTV